MKRDSLFFLTVLLLLFFLTACGAYEKSLKPAGGRSSSTAGKSQNLQELEPAVTVINGTVNRLDEGSFSADGVVSNDLDREAKSVTVKVTVRDESNRVIGRTSIGIGDMPPRSTLSFSARLRLHGAKMLSSRWETDYR